MRVLLINPMVALFGWNCWSTKDRTFCSLPHGLLSIATVLKQHKHEVRILDWRRQKDMIGVIRFIRHWKPDVVGISAMSVDFEIAVKSLRIIKDVRPKVKTVIGGVHATIAPEEALKPFIDFIVRGEGELTLTDMVDTNFKGYERITWGEIPDLDKLPFIDRDLVDYRGGELLTPYWVGKSPYVTMMAGRGCPYRCAFCHPVSMTVFRKIRQRSPSNIIAEMKECLDKYNAAYFDFIDDTFTLNPDWVSRFCNAYRKSRIGRPFVVSSRADIITRYPEMFSKLHEVGCDAVTVGFESGNDRILKLLRKDTTRQMNIDAARILRQNNLKIISNVMWGMPTETVQEARETASMIKEIKPDVNNSAWFTLYPGCDLYEEYRDLSLVTKYVDMNRYPGSPKIKGVNYKAIQKIMSG